MKLSLSLALVALLFGSVAHCQCIGFVNKGDVFVNCKGRESRITHRGAVEQFAVAPNASALVLEHHQRSGRRIEIVSLKDGSSVWGPNRGTFDVTQSCGTVIGRELVEDGFLIPGTTIPRNTFKVRDVLTDQLLIKSPYRQFACNADSKIIIGVTDSPAHLRIGTPPGRDLGTIEQDNLVQFSISPDGQYVAYLTDSDSKIELCASSISAANSACMQLGVFPVAGLSINEGGSVLFGLGDDECLYGQHRAPNSCSNVFEWHAGQAEPKRLMSGESPVWLTDSQASTLAEFASKVTRSNHTARTTQH
jgi:hypothetical protein